MGFFAILINLLLIVASGGAWLLVLIVWALWKIISSKWGSEGNSMFQKKRFEDLKPGDNFYFVDDNGIDFFGIKTSSLHYFDADTDSQVMQCINAVNTINGSFTYINRDKEVEFDDFSELES